MKKKMTERTRQSAAAQKNAIRLLPTNRVNHGDTPPKNHTGYLTKRHENCVVDN